MRTVFTPLNDISENVIVQKAHLILEEEIPECLLQFVTHVVGYKELGKMVQGRLFREIFIECFSARAR